MRCQFSIAEQIVSAKADYVLALKGNQGEFHDDIKLFMMTHFWVQHILFLNQSMVPMGASKSAMYG